MEAGIKPFRHLSSGVDGDPRADAVCDKPVLDFHELVGSAGLGMNGNDVAPRVDIILHLIERPLDHEMGVKWQAG